MEGLHRYSKSVVGSDGKMAAYKKATIDGKEVEIPKYFEIEDDKFGKIVFGEESFQGSMIFDAISHKKVFAKGGLNLTESSISTERSKLLFQITKLQKKVI